ncbi:amino acid adenylation domain-containing protein [Streptomyces sp. NPDC088725]|uniref:amino acid adenylation domain-containing protein n=1 Tax=Streptomyces sp. NPDC088725 TaxID=3365873 RepID=UPI00380A5FAC
MARGTNEQAQAGLPGDSPADSPDGAGLAHRVLARAGRTPDVLALVDGGVSLDYAGLDAASAAVARGLLRHGVRPGQAVAVSLPRSWQLVCAMLGILRLGAVVVPLDAQSPPERRRHILADSGSVTLIHSASAASDPGLPDGVGVLEVAKLLEDDSEDTDDLPPFAAAPASFIFYTSGTTGRPKGVEVRDAGILRLARPGYFGLREEARFACLSNPAFDALSFEVWVPLLTGGCCVILADEAVQTPHLLADTLRRERIDTLFITVALFNAVVDKVPDCFADVRQVLVGGEQLNARLIQRWYRDNARSGTRLHNVYGPTESTTFALCHPIPRDFDADVVPIGQPLPGTEALLVVDGTRLAAPGEVAELHLAGEGLAVGYRNLPEETERRFVRLPWHDGGHERHYRTGDLVRRDAAGHVEYVGRADRQVKVRGFRIEPGELERQIVTHPAVRQAYVCTRREAVHGVNELLAYLVLRDDLTFDDFERHVAGALPPYMRPHRVHLVDELPLNANGKVDQAALFARDGQPWRRSESDGQHADPAATAWQREVLELAGQVLGVTELRLGDRWTANGGDSLKALRLRFEVRERWGCELPQALVLHSDFAELAAAIDAGRSAADSPYPATVAPADARSAPATSEQQRLWLLQQQTPGSSAYNVGMAFRLRGTVDTAALRRAVRRLVERHPALRTAFEAAPEGLRQVVAEPYDPWTDPGTAPDPLDGDGWRGVADRLFSVPFDLSRPEMFQACWLPQDGGGVLLLHLHHIAVDGWSLNVLFRALSADYAAELDGTAPAEHEAAVPTPLDYAAWQADWFTRPAYLTQRAALAAHYGGTEEAAPLEPVRTAPRPEGRLLRTPLDLVRRAALDRLGAELGLTRFPLLLSVFAWSLYGVTGRVRPRIAGPVAGRPVRDFEDSVGMFANTVLLPQDLAPRDGLRAQLIRQAADAQAVLDRQDVALADVLADVRAEGGFRSEGTPFDFMFVLENTDFSALALPGCASRPEWPVPAEAKCPLTLSVIEHESGFDCLWEYADDHFDAEEVAAMADLFGQGLDRLAEGGTGTLAELVAPYRRSLPDPGRGASTLPAAAPPASAPAVSTPDAFTTVAEGFDRQVRLTPDAPALVSDGRSLTYAELDAHAAALAAELHAAHPLPPGDDLPRCVALYFGPSVEHVVALLALARLNLTIVPLDPAYPAAQSRQVLGQVQPLCVLLPPGGEAAFDAMAEGADNLPRHPVTLSAAPADDTGSRSVPSAGSASALPPHSGQRPLYTLFTSGSTGTPKGVQVPDSTLCNLLHWQGGDGGLGAPAVTQQFSMLSFDVSFQEIFSTLCGGGALHLVRPGWRQDAPALLAHLEEAGIERVFMPYVALQLLAEHGVHLGLYPSRLREVITAGEQLLCTDAIRRWFAGLPDARLFNHYGPTETHVVSGLCLDGDPALWPERPSIGRPVDNAWLRVVDDADEAVPPGRSGHLLIGGTMAAPCYLGDETLNRERFVELPGLGLFYRSGDQARFDGQGLLHYLGRDDQQVKLSGHRLELGQVEAALLQHPDIVNAVVVRDGRQLVACLQCRNETPTPEALADHLAPLLPAYVRIARYRRLDALPLTPSGKLDRRRALAAPGEELRSRAAAAPVLSVREAQLAEAYETVIGEPIGPDQRFFDAGASSLGLMRFHLYCTTELGLRFTIPDLFEHVTVRSLARFLEPGEQPAPPGPATTADARTPGQRSADDPVAVIGMAVRLPGADDLAAFWDMVKSGGRGIEHFDADDGLVGARSQMAGLLSFDPEHFGISRQEARLMDPQQRHLLMSSVEALAHAGIAEPAGQRIGMIAGCGENTYFQSLSREADPARLPDGFQMALHHDKDFLTTKVAYHLGLTGPAFSVQAACASSLIAVHVAAGLLRQGDADVMLAGGVLVDTLLTDGYQYRPQHIFSKDGHCRPFSDDASGTIGASGVGVVVLKPLSLARRDGDTVYAVITGSAINNDGASKLSYSAPSLAGQREVIRTALRRSGRTGADLGYVEAHGTGTQLGDPVEIGALRQAFDLAEADHCALASVKSQIGHLGAAAGVVGLVRAVLAVHHGVIPPNVDFHRLNPQIGTDVLPFYIPEESSPWPAGRERVAAVSSFGIGGTNAHVVLEAGAPTSPDPENLESVPSALVPCLPLSSNSEAGLIADAARVADYLEARPEAYGQVLRHLQAGRPPRRYRLAVVCAGVADAVVQLRDAEAHLVTRGAEGRPAGPVVAADVTAEELAAAWLSGASISGPSGPAQAPWDFPPPAFELAEYDFERAAPPAEQATPALEPAVRRLPEPEWLHQPHWVRLRRAVATTGSRASGVLVAMTAQPLAPEALRPFEAAYEQVVRVSVGDAFARLEDGGYEVDPADAASLRQLLDALSGLLPDEQAGAGEARIDWLHALPLAVEGAVDDDALARARWACLDSPAALIQAVAGMDRPPRLRVWWLSYQAQPVEGEVRRPELGLLAGACEVTPQESAVESHWLDLPGSDLGNWTPLLPALLTEANTEVDTVSPRRLALRQGYWWQPTLLPVAAPAASAPSVLPAEHGVYLVLGGTGGIGSSLAAWLLERADCRVLLMARRPQLPPVLEPWSDRVELIDGDLTGTVAGILARIDRYTDRLDGVVHAAGTAAGGLMARRDADAMRLTTVSKLRGALLVERLIARYRPAFAAYCSSMAALFGGVGQLDYAAANGLLDGFARHRADESETTLRVGIDWDIWSEVGMARRALRADARHQAHLAVGLDVAEGQRIFARALQLQLPQLLVSTATLEESRGFYAAPAEAPAAVAAASVPAAVTASDTGSRVSATVELTEWLCHWLGLDELDPDASLYDLGADSLTLLDLIGEVKRLSGVDIELSQLSHRASFADILARMGATASGTASIPDPVAIEVWQQGSGRDLLCLIHPVGGDIQAYRALVSALDPRLTVCLIADPALQWPDRAAWSLDERVQRYHRALNARFPQTEWRRQLAGWSYGAWVALGMAAEAEAEGSPVAGLYLLDPPPPGAGPRFRAYDEAELEAMFTHELGQGGARERAGQEAKAYAERLAHCCRANLASMAGYELPRPDRTPSQLWLASLPVAGLPELGSPDEQQRSWQQQLRGLVSSVVLDTTHYDIVRPPQVRTVAEAINAASLPVLGNH